jgi:carbonic anhydrase/acetyltransferase-like protein (isoleucine patch superfamily)
VIVAGDVEIGAETSLWFGTVVRGDVEAIRIGARSNLQDHCIVHVTKGLFPAWIGDEVTVGHRAIVHGCTVRDGALVGIAAVLLDGAEVGEEALVGAGALVTQGAKIPARHLAIGAPARVVRPLSAEEIRLQRERAHEYVATARKYAGR